METQLYLGVYTVSSIAFLFLKLFIYPGICTWISKTASFHQCSSLRSVNLNALELIGYIGKIFT